MAAEPTAITNPPAPDAQAPASPAVQANANPVPTTGDDAAALKAQVEALLKWKGEAEADLKKGRDAKKAAEEKAAAEKADAEKKAREAGDFAKLHDAEREKRTALEAQLAEIAPKAEKASAHEKRTLAKLEAAKAKGDLPSFIVRAIDNASKVDVDEALDILDDYRASIGTGPAPKQPAPPAPPQGGAPASPPAKKRLEDLTVAEIHQLKAEGKLNELLGQGSSNGERPALFRRFFA
jgi:hypothetical protein